jgi:lipopolysaccharide export system protein LptA
MIFPLLAVVTAVLAGPTICLGQRLGEMKGFKFAEYYAAPQETQMKSLLEGATARRLDDGRIVVTGAKLQTFKSNGEREILIEAPHCMHDPEARSVSSEGPLSARTADGKFAIAGEGFRWGQTNQWLIISNRVHTTVHSDLVADPERESGGGAAGATNAFDVHSDRFEYRSETGLAVYERNVRVTGTNVALRGGRMELELPMEERQLKRVSATEDVAMEYTGMRAWGQRVVYDLETGLARVTGEPRWESEQRRGRAEEFVIDRTNRVVLASGGAWLSMPAENLGATALLSPPRPGTPAAAAGTNQVVEISAASYVARSNLVVFNGPVALTNVADGQPGGSLTCGTLTATFTGTNEVETLVAEREVAIRQEDNVVKAARAFYTATNNLLELTGEPNWRSGDRTGKGEIIYIDGTKQEMLVRGNASMRLPPEELGSRGGAPGAAAGAGEDEAAPAEIFSEEYAMRADSALFRGGVYISHPRMAWACETMRIQLPAGGSPEQRIEAEQKVFFNLVDDSGQRVNGSAERAVYTYAPGPQWTNELVELTGNPVITTTNGTFRNRTIVLDRTRNKLVAPGRYVIRGLAPGDTNKFTLPDNKWLK